MSLFLYDSIQGGNRAAFANKVITISNQLNINPDWLMVVMKFESGLNSKAQNTTSGATGLIQFMPSTAIGMGTTTTDLYNMSNVEQLDYVYLYLSKFAGEIRSLTDLYLTVFYPVAIGKSEDYILGNTDEQRKKIARQNKIFDTNNDGYITKAEVKQYIESYAKRIGFVEEVKKKVG